MENNIGPSNKIDPRFELLNSPDFKKLKAHGFSDYPEKIEFIKYYQANYGGGSYDDKWEETDGLYTTEEFAKDRLKELGFKWKVFPSGYEAWTQEQDFERDIYDRTPHWGRVERIEVIK